MMPDARDSRSRVDIQVLRGVAVLLVMMYHARFPVVQNGFLGVDVFFVISGFLITRIILDGLEQGNFSFGAFYRRRAWRLLPAAFTVFLVTSLAGAVLLSSRDLLGLLSQLLASMTFLANMYFWQKINYFAGAADHMPLLHIWSLSLEEQFYFVLPLLLFLMPRRLRLGFIVVAAVASLLLCHYLVLRDPQAAFFLLPSRAWELLLGSILAAARLPGLPGRSMANLLALVCLALMLAAVVVDIGEGHPRYNAMLVCLATFTLLWLRADCLSYGLVARVLARVGDISYSLYLVHWPLMAIARNLWLDGDLPQSHYAALFLISFPLAWLLYNGVEQRFRHGLPCRKVTLLLAMPLAVLCILLPVVVSMHWTSTQQRDWAAFRGPNLGFSFYCDYKGPFVWRKECSDSGKPEVLVWGDSYAMHLVPGLREALPGRSLVQATRSSCAPNLHIAQVSELYNRRWAGSCIEFNRSVVDYIREHQIRYVILAARLQGQEGDFLVEGRVANLPDGLMLESFAETLEAVRQAGATPIVIAPPPVDGSNVGECLERNVTGRFYISHNLGKDCRVVRARSEAYQHDALALLKALESDGKVTVVWPSRLLCDSEFCAVEIDGVPLYRDDGHYSITGSKRLVPQLQIPLY